VLRIPQTFELIGVEQHGGMLCSDRLSEVLDIALSDVAGRNTGVAEVRALPVILSHQYPDLIISDAINHGTGKNFHLEAKSTIGSGCSNCWVLLDEYAGEPLEFGNKSCRSADRCG